MKLKMLLLHFSLAALAAPSLAFAVLGGDVSSIQSDRMQMKADSRIAKQAACYTLHELTTPGGTVIREYATVTGKVFAVAWSGPKIPDLRQLMGAYFDTYANAATTLHAGHSQFAIRQDGLVARSSGHMGAFSGSVYVPGMLPQGVVESDIN